MKHWITIIGIATFLIAIGGCDDSNSTTGNQNDLGGIGESCNSRKDCQAELACVGQICTAMSAEMDGGANGDNGDDVIVDPRGGAGESCTSRRDCQEGLGCFDNTCLAKAPDDAGVSVGLTRPSDRSQLGESCLVRNDCEDGLACVGGYCIDDNIDIEVSTKSCVRVECEKTEDCCLDYQPVSSSCDFWESQCNTDTDPFSTYCNYHELYCTCNDICKESLCVTPDLVCVRDEDCSTVFLPFCVNTGCVECKTNTDCLGENDRCDEGNCTPPCKNNEQCPLMHACQEGLCVEVGCTTDRECFLLTYDPKSSCRETKCQTPCVRDEDCTMVTTGMTMPDPFQICDNEFCVFMGCQTDEECRILENIANVDNSNERIVCQ